MRGRPVALAAWVAAMALCLWALSQARFVADLSMFLPEAPTEEQRLLVDHHPVRHVVHQGAVGADGQAVRADRVGQLVDPARWPAGHEDDGGAGRLGERQRLAAPTRDAAVGAQESAVEVGRDDTRCGHPPSMTNRPCSREPRHDRRGGASQ